MFSFASSHPPVIIDVMKSIGANRTFFRIVTTFSAIILIFSMFAFIALTTILNAFLIPVIYGPMYFHTKSKAFVKTSDIDFPTPLNQSFALSKPFLKLSPTFLALSAALCLMFSHVFFEPSFVESQSPLKNSLVPFHLFLTQSAAFPGASFIHVPAFEKASFVPSHILLKNSIVEFQAFTTTSAALEMTSCMFFQMFLTASLKPSLVFQR